VTSVTQHTNLFNPSGYSRLMQSRFTEPAGLLLSLSIWPVGHTNGKDYVGLMDVGENMNHLTENTEDIDEYQMRAL